MNAHSETHRAEPESGGSVPRPYESPPAGVTPPRAVPGPHPFTLDGPAGDEPICYVCGLHGDDFGDGIVHVFPPSNCPECPWDVEMVPDGIPSDGSGNSREICPDCGGWRWIEA